jgi:hypothetical protein
MYEVQWQAASAAAAVPGTSSVGVGLHRQGAVLALQDRSGELIVQVPMESLRQELSNTRQCMASCIMLACSLDINSVHSETWAACWKTSVMVLQDLLRAPSTPGTAARLAAAQVAALQQRLAAAPASLQLLGVGDSIAAQPIPAPLSRRGQLPGAVRSLAAMLRVASVEAPAVRFSAVEVAAVAPASATSPAAIAAASASAAADAHGQSLLAGAWLGPRLVERQQKAAEDSAPGSGSEAGFIPPTGRILVTGSASARPSQ